MKIKSINVNKYIRVKDAKEVFNHNLDAPGGLFDPNIFGVNEEKRYKMGYIKLNGHFIDPSTYIMVSRRIFRDLPHIVSGTKKFIINDKGILEQNPNGFTGLKWLYENYGKFRFKQKKEILDKYTREEFFTDKILVLPQHYRDIDTTSGKIKIDEINQFYIDIIRNANFKKKQQEASSSIDTTFIDVKMQGLIVALTDQLANMTFHKNGAQESSAIGRSVDYSSRVVISAPEIKLNDTLGHTWTKLGYTCMPLHHLINMYPIHVISNTQKILKYFYDLGLMKIDIEEFEAHFNDEFIKEKMKAYFYSYKDRSSYVLGPNGEKFEFEFEFTDDEGNKTVIERGITYLELFYIALLEVRENTRCEHTRFPTTGKGSMLFAKFNILTTNVDNADMIIKLDDETLYDLKDVCNITHYIDNPKSHIYEETQKMSNLVLNSIGGDYDGDKMINRSVYAQESTEEIDAYNNKPLSVLDIGGKNIRTLGKEAVQSIYDLTRDDKNKPDYNSELNAILNDLFIPDRTFTLEEILNLVNNYSIYNKVKYKGNDTTLGRVIFNGVIFSTIDIPFVNEPVNGNKMDDILNNIASEYLLVDKITTQEYKDILDKYHDLAFGLADIICSPVTYDMLIKDDEVFNEKRLELMEKYNIKNNENINLLDMNNFEKEMVDFSKNYYKDDPMYNIYQSGSGPKWGVDFKNLKVSLGATPVPGSNDLGIVTNNLKDGIDTSDIIHNANSQIVGAMARGINVEIGGYIVKLYMAAFQSLFIYKGNCKSTKYLKTTDNNISELLGRTILLDNNEELYLDHSNAHKYLNKPIKKRTPIFCKQKGGFCSTCAGDLPLKLYKEDKMPIGLYIGEIGSAIMNRSMKATHDMTQKTFIIDDFDNFIDY